MIDYVWNSYLKFCADVGVLTKEKRKLMGLKIIPTGALLRPLNPKNNRRKRRK